MPLRDGQMDHLRRVWSIPVDQFSGLSGAGVSLHATVPALAEVGTLDRVGMPMTAADVVLHDIDYPWFMDPTQAIGVRVRFTQVEAVPAADGTTSWIVLYNQADRNAAMAAPASVLNTAIVAATAYPYAAVGHIVETSRGIINANTFDQDFREGRLTFSIELDAVANLLGDEAVLLALVLDYFPAIFADNSTSTNFLIS